MSSDSKRTATRSFRLNDADSSLFQVVTVAFYLGEIVAQKAKNDRSFMGECRVDIAGQIGVNNSRRKSMTFPPLDACLPRNPAVVNPAIFRDFHLSAIDSVQNPAWPVIVRRISMSGL